MPHTRIRGRLDRGPKTALVHQDISEELSLYHTDAQSSPLHVPESRITTSTVRPVDLLACLPREVIQRILRFLLVVDPKPSLCESRKPYNRAGHHDALRGAMQHGYSDLFYGDYDYMFSFAFQATDIKHFERSQQSLHPQVLRAASYLHNLGTEVLDEKDYIAVSPTNDSFSRVLQSLQSPPMYWTARQRFDNKCFLQPAITFHFADDNWHSHDWTYYFSLQDSVSVSNILQWAQKDNWSNPGIDIEVDITKLLRKGCRDKVFAMLRYLSSSVQ